MSINTHQDFEVFPWNKNFETSIPLIDEQHKKLVALLNQLASYLASHSTELELNSVFDELAAYADYHFKSEEQFWSQYLADDDSFSKHQQTHHSFLGKVVALKNADKALDDIVSDIIRFLTHWLTFHILDSDRRMALTILAIESGMDIEKAKQQADQTMSGSIEMLIDTVMMMYDSLSVRTIDLMREKMARIRAEEAVRLNEARWKFIMESVGDEVWEWDIAKDHVHRSENAPAILDLFVLGNINPEQKSTIHPDDLIRIQQDLDDHIKGKTDCFINEHRVMNGDGSCYWVLTRGKVISRNEEGKPLRIIGTHANITEREIASLLYQNSTEGMMVTDAENKIITVNAAFTEITGYSLDEINGKDPKFLRSGRHDAKFYKTMWDSLENSGQWQGEVWNRRKDGSIYPEWLTINNIYNPDKSVHYRFALFDDITERKVGEEAIWKQANFDVLTGLPNRQLFYNQLSNAIKTAKREHKILALLFIDLDNFKEVNDSLGHSTGDLLLIEVAKRLQACVRESDTVARLSGDEFTLILKSIDSIDGLEYVAENILDKLESPFVIQSNVLHVSASIGIALYPGDADEIEKLISNADQAMYQAKNKGRNRYAFFTPALQEAAQKRITIASELRHGLLHDEFQLYYQPIVELHSGKIVKAEALLRWQHPQRGMVGPDEFIPVAEDSGIINELGDWVFYQASKQLQLWQAKFSADFQISINKSPIQFQLDKGKHQQWFKYLQKHNIKGNSLIIEITERLLLNNDEHINQQLQGFAREGIQVSLDDFGTGYSSLSYIQEYDIDFLKIDRSFIQCLTKTSKNYALCKAIIMMAHALNIRVVAEGIETEEQKSLLQELGCDFGQGFLFSKPLPDVEFESKLLQ